MGFSEWLLINEQVRGTIVHSQTGTRSQRSWNNLKSKASSSSFINIAHIIMSTSSIYIIILCRYPAFQVGPIPVEDGIGKEVVTKLSTGMQSDKTFYTDSNGRDFIKRVNFLCVVCTL